MPLQITASHNDHFTTHHEHHTEPHEHHDEHEHQHDNTLQKSIREDTNISMHGQPTHELVRVSQAISNSANTMQGDEMKDAEMQEVFKDKKSKYYGKKKE